MSMLLFFHTKFTSLGFGVIPLRLCSLHIFHAIINIVDDFLSSHQVFL